MDYETKLIQARLDAIEAVLLSIAVQDADGMEKVRQALSKGYRDAKAAHDAPNVTTIQRAIQFEMSPARDRLGEQAKVEAFRRLCRSYGASMDE
ncbi:hypothetical protein C7399_109200 [Paraburkholderia tropica]|uniref:Uncharacterized protein n=1 Tax=Paraburkholderia tropica TaxID=92647 RepID=A0ABX5MNQ3_9BURK|nr:hypothetical protein [Paraburkholderia tropica]PXX15865.1 hypothetical protein C7400_109200 [Paraburkholderia tropica]PZW82124.1 hypothetical protein C7399_109200 [Paraburkholderia tropica]